MATAILTGALVVGDSVQGSLKALALDGLGRIEYAITATRFFHEGLASEIVAEDWSTGNAIQAVPVILLRGSMESGGVGDTRRAGGLSIIGCTERFWSLGVNLSESRRDQSAVLLTQSLADDLDVRAGDEVLLRLPISASLPAESLLGEKEDTVVSRRLRVATVLQRSDGLARFSLSPSQRHPRNAFVPLDLVQEMLNRPKEVNAILVAGNPRQPDGPAGSMRLTAGSVGPVPLARALRDHLRLEDYGVHLDWIGPAVENFAKTPDDSNQGPACPDEALDGAAASVRSRKEDSSYINISSDALVLPPHVVDCAKAVLQKAEMQPVSTYLANTINVGHRKIPYSTITGVDSTAQLGPLVTEDGKPIHVADNEIVLNDWAAAQLDARIGDRVVVRFYEPESAHGQLREGPPVALNLRAIVPLRDRNGRPTPAADRFLTPQIAGVTDQASIGDWQVPFPLIETIRPADETYWDDYLTTPKAFVSFAMARRLWSSRFGVVTSIRVDSSAIPLGRLREKLAAALDPRQLGFDVLSLRERTIAASGGATSFDLLFLGFSMFLIASAVMLIALLFQLGVQLRAGELGLLTSLGLPDWRVRRMFVGEAAIIAILGAAVGVMGGIGYAWLMLVGLRTLWIEAIGTSLMNLHVAWSSLGLGWILGLAAAIVPCWLAIRAGAGLPPRRLLHGDRMPEIGSPSRWIRWFRWAILFLVIAAVGLGFWGFGKSGAIQAGVFFGTGALVLLAMLVGVHVFLWRGDARFLGHRGRVSLAHLAMVSAFRNPGRSRICIGLVAAACFLIVAIRTFRLETNNESTGGFGLIAESDIPIQFDLGAADGRLELGFGDRENRQLASVAIHGCRVQDGDDASCLNMYRPRVPKILGMPEKFIANNRFLWAAAARRAQEPARSANPWPLLEQSLGEDSQGRPVVPVVLDADTAAYALHLGGVGTRFSIAAQSSGQTTFQIVGLLSKSLLQGLLLISEENFLRLYPQSGGYRFFLIDGSSSGLDDDRVATILESALGDYGFDATQSKRRLEALYAVQNTYLATFQTLGGLGLVMGTFGLAAVQLRSVVERRRELALMQALGFRQRRLAWMVLSENGVLLVTGIGIGTFAAVFALLPHWLGSQSGFPWTDIVGMLLVILVIGVAAGGIAVWKLVREPLMPALRGE
ncbi:MAG: ABC transporter permease [Pirellulales bacterium]|nr:ABC transporter permease [Pirellulales bacterium]